jgi:hemin uptake protein HemP
MTTNEGVDMDAFPADEPGRARGAFPQHAQRDMGRRCIDSGTLFAGDTELLIRHGGVYYRLKQTGLGKLILTK